MALSRAVLPLAAGAALAVAISAVYAIPYLRVHDRVGDRPEHEVAAFSARPSSYLTAPPENWWYGHTAGPRNGPERRLFPGAIPVFLAIIGLLLRVPSRRALVYLVLLAVAFETSLGVGGYLYPFLHEHVEAYRGLRASARLGIFVLMFLAVTRGVRLRGARRRTPRHSPRRPRGDAGHRPPGRIPHHARSHGFPERRPADLPDARAPSARRGRRVSGTALQFSPR